MTQPLSRLERACVELIAKHNWPTFRCDRLEVIRRENTGVGRYVYLNDPQAQELIDGTYGPEPGRAIQMLGVEFGLDFAVDVSRGRLNYLELVTSGNDGWDGEEREWHFV
ncbi:MAG: hypothetical protein ABI627_20300 [Polyangiaceae bacterium]